MKSKGNEEGKHNERVKREKREREQDLEIRLIDATWSNVTSDTSIDPSLSDYMQFIYIFLFSPVYRVCSAVPR